MYRAEGTANAEKDTGLMCWTNEGPAWRVGGREDEVADMGRGQRLEGLPLGPAEESGLAPEGLVCFLCSDHLWG